ncbi:MAG: hypothetical protein AB7T63_02945 [Planctomycetota bacterium]
MRRALTAVLVIVLAAGAVLVGRTAGGMLRRRTTGPATTRERPWAESLSKVLDAMDRAAREDARVAWDALTPGARVGAAAELVAAWLAEDPERLQALADRGHPPAIAARAAVEAIRLRERTGILDAEGRAAFSRRWPGSWWSPDRGPP